MIKRIFNFFSNNNNYILENSDLFPLKIGNSWLCTINAYDKSNNNIFIDSYGNKYPYDTNLRVISEFSTREGKVFFLQLESKQDKHLIYFLKKNDGYYVGEKSYSEINFFSQPLFIYPVKKHLKYNFLSDRIEVLSTNEMISVPAGTFKCYSYQIKSIHPYEPLLIRYLSPGIGEIKIVTILPSILNEQFINSKIVKLDTVLKSYKIL
ncbi:MAG TPA: hypothetical protein PKY56_00620 [Candidatus Kapabacteria bacterium]|nr:hypothetical protein [Candidatus Kapabacteria bacterium]HPO61620.1 hypothetical protein [Candidatus Kapabacteria bacterium]